MKLAAFVGVAFLIAFGVMDWLCRWLPLLLGLPSSAASTLGAGVSVVLIALVYVAMFGWPD